jgi:hypothetical protein
MTKGIIPIARAGGMCSSKSCSIPKEHSVVTINGCAMWVGDLIILVGDLETFPDKVQPGRGDVMTSQEAAVMLRCEPSAITCLIANGYLKAQKSTHGWQVAFDAFLDSEQRIALRALIFES